MAHSIHGGEFRIVHRLDSQRKSGQGQVKSVVIRSGSGQVSSDQVCARQFHSNLMIYGYNMLVSIFSRDVGGENRGGRGGVADVEGNSPVNCGCILTP